MADLVGVLSSQDDDSTVCYLLDSDNIDGELLGGKTVLYSGQAVQLEDGSTAFLQPCVTTDNLHEVKLEDGSTAYVALGVPTLDSLEFDNIPAGLERESIGLSEDSFRVSNAAQDGDEKGRFVVGLVEMVEDDDDFTQDGSHLDLKDDDQDDDPLREESPPSPTDDILSSEMRTNKTFACPEEGCGKKYSAQHHLKVHARSHTGCRPFKCDYPACDKMFRTNYALKAHHRTHTGEKPYKCPDSDCGKSFKTSGDLQKHIRTHTGERPFKCPIPGCDRAFTTSNIRKVHLRTHTGERPYECSEAGCDKAFASATNYKNHMRIHSGEKPYVCMNKSCGRRFTEYSSLYKHQTVHTLNKPFECQECGRHYRQASTLTVHRRTAHGIIQTADGTEVVLALPLPLSLQSADGKLNSLAFVELSKDEDDPLISEGGVEGKEDSGLTLPCTSDSEDTTSPIDECELTQVLVVADSDEMLAVECFDSDQAIR